MIKLKASKNTLNAQKKFLDKYFEFHKSKNQILESIDLDIFYSLDKLKNYIWDKFPRISVGKNTTLFWIQNGYSEKEAKKLRLKFKVIRKKNSSPMNIEFWVSKGFSEEESIFKIKSQRKLNIEYWISRGFSEEESIINQKKYQKDQNRKLLSKMVRSPEDYVDINTNQYLYWVKRGFSEEQSKLLVSKRQKTFSLDICLEKYGIEEGKKKWAERQEKWTTSLKNSKYDNSLGKSVPIKDRIKRIDINKLIDSLSLKNKEIYIYS